jgi:hypothetical protein
VVHASLEFAFGMFANAAKWLKHCDAMEYRFAFGGVDPRGGASSVYHEVVGS